MIATPGFDRVMAFVSCWVIAGGYLDAWAHANRPSLETFFTPWHAVLYSGLAAVAGVLGIAVLRRREGSLLPAGYGLTGVGVLVMLAGGLGDLAWHSAFGIERNFEALLSPTHITLMAGLFLIVTGPLRSSFARHHREAGYPALLSMGLALSIFGFLPNPLRNWPGHQPRPVSEWQQVMQAYGVVEILLQGALLGALVLYVVRRVSLPSWPLTIVLGINGLLLAMVVPYPGTVLVPVAAGIVGDVFLRLFGPHSLALPTALLSSFGGAYFLAVAGLGLWWSIHVWAGTVVALGLLGALLGVAVRPSEGITAGVRSRRAAVTDRFGSASPPRRPASRSPRARS